MRRNNQKWAEMGISRLDFAARFVLSLGICISILFITQCFVVLCEKDNMLILALSGRSHLGMGC